MQTVTFRTTFAAFALSLLLGGCQGGSQVWPSSTAGTPHLFSSTAETGSQRNLPPLVVTNEPAPDVIYRRGSRDTILASADTSAVTHLAPFATQKVETLVTRKVADLGRDLGQLQKSNAGYQGRLNSLQAKSDTEAAQYYELIAAINTELQSGTTPGNPVLIERWNVAQAKLEKLSSSVSDLNDLATDLSNEASKAAYLQESVRATYGLSGAVKEDHDKLRGLEDDVNQQIVNLNRLLTSVSDEINRRTAYLRSERGNMQTLSLAITNGELYGQNIANSLYKKATEEGRAVFNDAMPAQRRPLVVIRFDRPNVNYEQALYGAVDQVLQKYPSATFDLVAVSPMKGNPAEVALASTEARKNGEAVLRSLTQMGLPVERVRLNAANSADVRSNEVHLYLQ